MKPVHDADAVVGLLLVSGEGARLDEWRPGTTEEIERFELGEPMRHHHELLGPAASHPKGRGEGAPAFRSSRQRDLFEHRLEEHRVAFVRGAAARAAAVSRTRGWPLVIVLGDPRLGGPAAEELRRAGVAVERSERLLGWMTHPELARAIGPHVERTLLERAAGAGG
jgi:Bacterial archaeo-eukaryotic release factor family 10